MLKPISCVYDIMKQENYRKSVQMYFFFLFFFVFFCYYILGICVLDIDFVHLCSIYTISEKSYITNRCGIC